MTAIVQAEVDSALRDEATNVLAELGMTVDEAFQILLKRVVEFHEFPLELHEPNAETIEAMRELERGEGRRYNSVAEMFADIDNEL